MLLIVFIFLLVTSINGDHELLKHKINEGLDESKIYKKAGYEIYEKVDESDNKTSQGYEVYEKVDETEDNSTTPNDNIKWMIMPDGKGDISLAILSGLFPNTESNVEDIGFYLYSRQNPNKAEFRFMNSMCEPVFKYFKPGRPSKFLIHGFGDSISESLMYPVLKDAFIARGDYNIFMLDWSNLAEVPWYNAASMNTIKVGHHTAKFLDHLAKTTGMNMSTVHLIGFSLGSHVAGIIGKNVVSGRVKRITALDPAEILFTAKNKTEKLDSSDAELVEVIHTSGGYLGFQEPLGYRDIFPNGGIWPQPGCYIDYAGVCSHRRAYYYYGEAVKNKKGFRAIPCGSWPEYMTGACDKNLENSFELANDKSKRRLKGNFFLKTKGESPFGIESTNKNEYSIFDYFY